MCVECCCFKRQHSPLNTLGGVTMRIEEVVDGATQRVNLLKQQAKLAQKRAKEAALRMRMQKAQQSLVKLAAQ